MSWAADLQRIAAKGGDDLGTLAKAVKIELFNSVVGDTRVDTGRLRGNWQIQENRPSDITIRELKKGGSEAESFRQKVNERIMSKSTKDGLTYFSNNLPYAKQYENIDAMVGKNVTRVRGIVKEQARKIHK